MHAIRGGGGEGAFGGRLLPNFWNRRCGSNHQPTLVGDQCREKSHHAWETIIGTTRITTFGDIIKLPTMQTLEMNIIGT